MRLWIEVEAEGDEAEVRRLVEATCDLLMAGLVDAEVVMDPAVSLTVGVPEPVEWITPLS